MKFNFDDYKGKYVMHCKTREEARSFCDYFRYKVTKKRNKIQVFDDNTEKYSEYMVLTIILS